MGDDSYNRRCLAVAGGTEVARTKKVLGGSKATKADMEVMEAERPRTRADCIDRPRPCPYVSCRFHIASDVNKSGRASIDPMSILKISNCSLDFTDKNPSGASLSEIGEVFGTTKERIRQILDTAIEKILSSPGLLVNFTEDVGEDP